MSTSEKRSETEMSPSPKVPHRVTFVASNLFEPFFLHLGVLFLILFFAPQAKHRIAHKPNSMPKVDAVLDLREPAGEEDGEGEDEGGEKCAMTEEELWARLDELEKLEALQDEQDR